MPYAPPKHCPKPGHPPYTGKHCPLCAATSRAKFDANRPSAAARGYDAAWRRVRAAYLKAHPTCRATGCTAPATDVDHIQSIAERPDLRLKWSNLRGFCKSHHSQRTGREQGTFARQASEGKKVAEGGKGVRNSGQTALDRCPPSCAHTPGKWDFLL